MQQDGVSIQTLAADNDDSMAFSTALATMSLVLDEDGSDGPDAQQLACTAPPGVARARGLLYKRHLLEAAKRHWRSEGDKE